MKKYGIALAMTLLCGVSIDAAESEIKIESGLEFYSKPFVAAAEIASGENLPLEQLSPCIEAMSSCIELCPSLLTKRHTIKIVALRGDKNWYPLEFVAYCAGRSYWFNNPMHIQWMFFLEKILKVGSGKNRKVRDRVIFALSQGIRCVCPPVVDLLLKKNIDVVRASGLYTILSKQCELTKKYRSAPAEEIEGDQDHAIQIGAALQNIGNSLLAANIYRSRRRAPHHRKCFSCRNLYRKAISSAVSLQAKKRVKRTQPTEYRWRAKT